MKYLITGKNGQLAREFIRRFESKGIAYTAPEEARLDIADQKAVEDAVYSCKPDVIVNCAAYNQVDNAEQEPDKAFAVNAEGPRNLARAAAKQDAMLVHFGSDYVFDGQKENGLYGEDDRTAPLNVYGQSKLSGEELALKESDRSLVLRLSWVFGAGKQNFIYKLRSWADRNDYLKVACDEFSVPTSTTTVVDIALEAVRQGLTGRYHATNTGFCSRYEWAKLILNKLGIQKFVRPVSMDSFGLPAKRPRFSAMSNERIAGLLNTGVPGWEEAVGLYLRNID